MHDDFFVVVDDVVLDDVNVNGSVEGCLGNWQSMTSACVCELFTEEITGVGVSGLSE